MPLTNEDILARTFFDLADKVEQIAASELGQAVPTFSDDDYASVVATLLDAAYWVLASQLDTDLEEDPLGYNLYTSSSVYNDLLYRGYSAGWAWEESGMGEIFGHAHDHDDDEPGGLEPGESPYLPNLTASGLQQGDYVVARHEDGSITAGMMISATEMFSFDGRKDPVGSLNVTKISPTAAHGLLERHERDILKSVERWVDGQSG